MGYDSDHPRSEGEVGKCGVAIDTLHAKAPAERYASADEVARQLLYLGIALRNAVNIFNPEAVVVCGGVTLAAHQVALTVASVTFTLVCWRPGRTASTSTPTHPARRRPPPTVDEQRATARRR